MMRSSVKKEAHVLALIDLGGKTVLPGLFDAHVHAVGAGLSEYKQALPPLGSIAEIQDYIRAKAKTTPKGEWIVVPRTLAAAPSRDADADPARSRRHYGPSCGL